jgi:hypothetical protein
MDIGHTLANSTMLVHVVPGTNPEQSKRHTQQEPGPFHADSSQHNAEVEAKPRERIQG